MADSELFSSIYKLTIADLRNELEFNHLPTDGTKLELAQRLYKFKRLQNPSAKSSTGAKRSRTLPSVGPNGSFSREGNSDSKDVGASSETSELVKLYRKLKLFGTSIEMIFAEIPVVERKEKSRPEMENLLRRLTSSEQEYSAVVQDLIGKLDNEDVVNSEIQRWGSLQQEISRMVGRAEKYIVQDREEESARQSFVQTEDKQKHDCNGVSHLRLPKFTISEFAGVILEWVSWWDQFKTCIHENSALGDREKFNYLRMYVSGTAKKSIEYIEVSGENYLKTIEALKKRYGRKRIVVEHLVESILNMEKKEKVNAVSLRYLYDNMVSRYHTLQTYEPNLEACHRILIPILQAKLPQDIRRKWEYELSKIENEEEDKKITVEYFFDFLRAHVMSEEAAEKSRHAVHEQAAKFSPKLSAPRWRPRYENLPSSATALTGNTKNEEITRKLVLECAFCNKQHDTSNCYMIQRKPVDERLKIVQEKKLCFNCLRPIKANLTSASCNRPGCSIEGCSRKHHVLLHRVTPPSTESRNVETQDESSGQMTGQSGVGSVVPTDNQARVLPTAQAYLLHDGNKVPVRILVDSGSDHSYIRQSLAESLKLPSVGASKLMTILMHGGESRRAKVKNVQFQLLSLVNNQKVNLTAWTVNTICAPLGSVNVDLANYSHLRGLTLADKFPRGPATVDLLIGADQWSQIIQGGVKRGPRATPFAMNSVFGWLLSGCFGSTPHAARENTASFNFAIVKTLEDDQDLNFNLKKFWELESIGIVDSERKFTRDEEDALQQFKSSISYDGERYEVGLPWKRDHPQLKSNRQQAFQRLHRIKRSLNQDPKKKTMYANAVQQYLDDGHAREVTAEDEQMDKVYYLPHHPVFREDKSTTKCRVVFDASSKDQNGNSLNDCLLVGPALQPDLVSILTRFRLHKVGMMADIKKMFLQIKLAKKDQNVHRFLWRKDELEEPKTCCMTRVTFGDACSPFLAIATVRHHAESKQDQFPQASKEVKENMYVDDYLGGEENAEKALHLHKDLYEMMKTGGFDLVKWSTNSPEFLKLIHPDLRQQATVVDLDCSTEPLKALGVSWDTNQDVLLFKQGDKLVETSPDVATKRSLISTASKLFDPLGYLSPYTVRSKILFQELWLKAAHWDDPLPHDIATAWQQWKDELAVLKDIKIQRCFSNGLDEIENVQLHGFSDASPKAYGAVIYLRLQDVKGQVKSNIVIAKSKVAPTKRVTLPRLELLGAYVLSKLVKYVLNALSVKVHHVVCWTDSTVTLEWIQQTSSKWKVFVANRVQEIQENVPPEHWRFCPGHCNPADDLTRGNSLPQLADNSTWWYGPEWLKESEDKWPKNEFASTTSSIEESNVEARCKTAVIVQEESCIDQACYQRWIKLLRLTAQVLKAVRLFKQKSLSRNQVGQENHELDLTVEEIKGAETYWLKRIQMDAFQQEHKAISQGQAIVAKSPLRKLAPFVDAEGLIRVGGRLQFAELPEETKHQVILPSKHAVVEKLILHIHAEAAHAGPETTLALLREWFWLLRGRRTVKEAINQCRICRRYQAKPQKQQMAPLPKERANLSPAFTHVGVDFTGHLILKVKSKSQPDVTYRKAYICIFTCATSRMVHLELTNDMTTDEFLQAFRRMYNRRGLCRTICSDNQTTFKKASKDIQTLYETSKQRVSKVWKKIDKMHSKGR